MNKKTLVIWVIGSSYLGAALAAPPVFKVRQVRNQTSVSRFVDRINGINDLGQVVGDSLSTSVVGPQRGFLWDPVTGYRGLGTTNRDDPTTYSIAWGVNDKGVVVGQTGSIGPFLYTQRAVKWVSGKMTLLPKLPGESGSWATGINNQGQIVGNSVSSFNPFPSMAVLWQDGTVEKLPLPQSTDTLARSSTAAGITDGGMVFGTRNPIAPGFSRYERLYVLNLITGERTGLKRLPGDIHVARAMNKNGKVVGHTNGQAATWSGASHTLNVLGPGGGGSSTVSDVSDLGAMVGRILDTPQYWKAGIRYVLLDLIDPASPYAGCVQFGGDPVINNKNVVAVTGVNLCEGPDTDLNSHHMYVLTPK